MVGPVKRRLEGIECADEDPALDRLGHVGLQHREHRREREAAEEQQRHDHDEIELSSANGRQMNRQPSQEHQGTEPGQSVAADHRRAGAGSARQNR